MMLNARSQTQKTMYCVILQIKCFQRQNDMTGGGPQRQKLGKGIGSLGPAKSGVQGCCTAQLW